MITKKINYSSQSEVVKKFDIQNEGLNKINLYQETGNKKIVPKAIHTKEKKILSKDSVDITTKKVIIVKKVIQRDTIFIERPN